MVAALKLMVKRDSNGRQISNGVGRRSLVRYVEAIVCCVCRVTIFSVLFGLPHSLHASRTHLAIRSPISVHNPNSVIFYMYQ